MKKVIIFSFILLTLFSCNDSKEKKLSKKEQLSEFFYSIGTNDIDKFYSYLPSKDVLNGLYLDSDTEKNEIYQLYGLHFKSDKIEFLKQIKSNFRGTSQDWKNVKPNFAYIRPGKTFKGLVRSKINLFFSDTQNTYLLKLETFELNGQSYYVFRNKELNPIDKNWKVELKELKDKLKSIKSEKPEIYNSIEIIEFEE